MIDSAVSDLPLPDSPTRQSVSPAATLKRHVNDRRHEAPVLIEAGGEVGDREQGFGIRVRGPGLPSCWVTPDP